MTSFITKTALAAIVALGAFGATAPANAAQVDVIVRTPHVVVRRPVVVVRPAPVVIVRPSPVVVVRPGFAGRCQPGLALQKAANRGLNRVAINNIGPNRVVVSGRIRGAWAKISFANVRGCPRL